MGRSLSANLRLVAIDLVRDISLADRQHATVFSKDCEDVTSNA